ncbi:hypothetical protein [Polaromonas jejuensis]|uniref:Uncharacterized protein n=1 Tax=Polaromonas jejuensis TaxID=457502 RepID=A0ABW0QCV8_9BURK|nr:hypothetical protein [Polaromonas jejuensis]
MNQAFHLDFLGGQQRFSIPGGVFLAAGIALAGWQLLEYSQFLQANAELHSELQGTLERLKINKQDVKRQPAQTPQERSAIALARAATDQLNYPWDSLLNLVETAQHPDVALLALEPKSRNGQIRLTAEAKDATAMMGYVAGLQQNPLLQNAFLTTHQVQLQQPGTPFKFQVLGQWKGIQTATPSDSAVDATTTADINDKVAP